MGSRQAYPRNPTTGQTRGRGNRWGVGEIQAWWSVIEGIQLANRPEINTAPNMTNRATFVVTRVTPGRVEVGPRFASAGETPVLPFGRGSFLKPFRPVNLGPERSGTVPLPILA